MRRFTITHALRLTSLATTGSALAAGTVALVKGTESVQFEIAAWVVYTTAGGTLVAMSLLFWNLISSSYRRHREMSFSLRGGNGGSYINAFQTPTELGKFGAGNDDALPTVDPADLQNVWAMLCLFPAQAAGQAGSDDITLYERVCSPGADVNAVWFRASMLQVFAGKLVPWTQNGELDDVVFQVAATFPMKKMSVGVVQQGPPFDVEEFVKQIGARSLLVSREYCAIQ
jgi:hypothetical protein